MIAKIVRTRRASGCPHTLNLAHPDPSTPYPPAAMANPKPADVVNFVKLGRHTAQMLGILMVAAAFVPESQGEITCEQLGAGYKFPGTIISRERGITEAGACAHACSSAAGCTYWVLHSTAGSYTACELYTNCCMHACSVCTRLVAASWPLRMYEC